MPWGKILAQALHYLFFIGDGAYGAGIDMLLSNRL